MVRERYWLKTVLIQSHLILAMVIASARLKNLRAPPMSAIVLIAVLPQCLHVIKATRKAVHACCSRNRRPATANQSQRH